jgi:hypothetical protein
MTAQLRARILSLVVSFAASSGFAAQTGSGAPFDVIRDFGLFAAKPQAEFCLSIKNPALKRGQELTLIWAPVEDPLFKPEIRYGRVIEKLSEPCDAFNHGENDATYRLDAGKLEPGRIYFAIVGRHNQFMILRGNVRGIVGSNELSFRSCTSMESIHFTIWSGEALTGKRLGHAYYYLGYDTEPTCTEADFKD